LIKTARRRHSVRVLLLDDDDRLLLFAGEEPATGARFWFPVGGGRDFVPRDLAARLRRLLAEGPPPAPIEVGI
jgi:hypothetical protein